ncbi:MAG TPA: hypothetical protein DCQ06_02290 [Myxococcales bacterium]|nr:hypothetical protein [Myxococcales bacterium]HAN30404.1 hypothetical protein [Myxococcales bacterium]
MKSKPELNMNAASTNHTPSDQEAMRKYRQASLSDPAVLWCVADNDDEAAEANTLCQLLERARQDFGQRNLWVYDDEGAPQGCAWVTQAQDDEQIESLQSAADRLVQTLYAQCHPQTVDRYLTYAEASDSMTPSEACMTVSGLFAPSPRGIKLLCERMRHLCADARVPVWVETCDAKIYEQLLAAGGQSGGQIWLANLVIYGVRFALSTT